MVLSDRDIRRCLADGRIRIEPPIDLDLQLGPCSIDLRLGRTFRVFEHSRYPYVDTRGDIPTNEIMREIEIEPEGTFVMQPGELVLAITEEYIELADDLLARLEGRSSLGRLGIIVHGTASVFDPGWRGRATLELGNLGRMPVKLYAGMRICSFTFEQLTSPAERPYWKRATSKYVNQSGPEASRLGVETG